MWELVKIDISQRGEGEWMKPEFKNFEAFGTDPKEVEELLSRVKESVTLKDKRN